MTAIVTRGDAANLQLPDERLRSILSRTIPTESGCWEWQGARDRKGYGKAGYGPRHLGTGLVHRMVWASLRGAIPLGLEPVTHEENVRRGKAGLNLLERAAAVTHCPQGHRYDEANTYRRRDRPQVRECRTCRNEASRQNRQRKASR